MAETYSPSITELIRKGLPELMLTMHYDGAAHELIVRGRTPPGNVYGISHEVMRIPVRSWMENPNAWITTIGLLAP